jgi:hypothetical protein
MLMTYRASSSGDLEVEGGTPLTGGMGALRSTVGRFVLGFIVAAALLVLWLAIDPGLSTVWDRTIGYQAGRDSPFSIWGQAPSLEPLRVAILAGLGALSIALAFRPRFKTLTQVAALGAALLIGAQLTMQHWFYLYIVWFYPLLLVAMAVGGPLSRTDTQSRPTT